MYTIPVYHGLAVVCGLDVKKAVVRAMARPEDGHAAHETSDGDDDAGYAKVTEKVSAGTRGHTGDPVSGLSMVGDAVSCSDPGTLTQKKDWGRAPFCSP